MTGKVKWFNAKRVMVSSRWNVRTYLSTSLPLSTGFKALCEGESVSFEIVEGDRGPRLQNVRL